MQLIGTNVLAVPVAHVGQQDATTPHFGLKYCPSMDLVATYPYILTSEEAVEALEKAKLSSAEHYVDQGDEISIDIYRLNGQKVFTITIENDNATVHVIDLSWRADGVMFAVTTSDNMVRLVNSFSGKVILTHSCVTNSVAASFESMDISRSPSTKRKPAAKTHAPRKRQCMPTLIKYSTHFLEPEDARVQFSMASEERGIIIDDLVSLDADVRKLMKMKPDLPGELANIDVEQYLPKLSTLPPNGLGEEDVFSNRTSIDAIFHSTKKGLGSSYVDVVTAAQSDGYVHVRIFDSFEVGDIDLNSAANSPAGVKFGGTRHIATHPFSSSIYLFVEEKLEARSRQSRSHARSTKTLPSIHVLSLNLQFLQHSGSSLPILATKATQLQNLIRYLQQIQSQMARDVKSAFDLPARFIRNLDQDLEEQDGPGSTFETSAYNSLLIGQVHGKFKEWLVDVLKEQGVKRWDKAVSDCLELIRRLVHENWNPAVERAGILISSLSGVAWSDEAFGIDSQLLNSLRDIVDVMAVSGEDLLKDVNTELTGFSAFAKWLKREVEMAGLEDTSEKLDEMREMNDYADVKKVMKYIANSLRATSVKRYIHDDPDDLQVQEVGEHGYYDTFKQTRTGADKRPAISLKSLTTRLTSQCDQLFQQVASKLRERVLVEYVCLLGDGFEADTLDACVRWESNDLVLHVVGKERMTTTGLRFFQTTLNTTTTKFSKGSVQQSTRDQGSKILDVKIVDDTEILVLATDQAEVSIGSISFCNLSQHSICHIFGSTHDRYLQAGLMPRKLEVNGRKGRRTLTVLDEHGRGYGVFDLDSRLDTTAEHTHNEIM